MSKAAFPADSPHRYEVVYSPDDEAACGRGYYIKDWHKDKLSQLFLTAAQAQRALAMRSRMHWE